ncbi:type VI secretion system Vgr family protein [Brytella acorum]|uniref:Type VI secretion system tip protein TssI/VgrG n=1 Tax=Brytella acorum TaxID=2959299 RepID=A0AA35VE13_9PROT|nr:type VI secretion system tip protein TssI/VgrG [Brytella acorum]CAI9121510.1 type VI secretion system tip protein TssI/VgrG [Brytella acorum]
MGGELQNLLLLTSPLGDDTKPFQTGTLHAIGLRAAEQISEPFQIAVDVVSTDKQISPDSLLHQPVTVTVRRKDGTDRYFNGLVRHISSGGVEHRGRWEYRLDVVPSLWFLSQTHDCRIFQKKTAVEILRQIFSEHGVQPVDFRVTGSQAQREYTTQFNENDLAFCQRIMQESGLFYYFVHEKGQHTLVVANANQGFRVMAEPLHRVMAQGDNVDIISSWQTAKMVSAGAAHHQDYDPTRPSAPVIGRATADDAGPGASKRKNFLWPAMTTENDVARDRARYALEASAAQAGLANGTCHDPHFCPGFRFQIDRNPAAGGSDFVVHSARHSARDDSWLGGTAAPQYEVSFSAFANSLPWREPATHKRPVMSGIYSAIVLGEGGEEIHVDPLGRIKVRLLFDHREDTRAGMAIWARVLHSWAGNKWGWQHLPRVGTEVGVSFMSGDCDNPVVLGCFYHEQARPVFDLPSEKTKMGFRSRSTLGGGSADFNELSFDDALGQEMMFMHAQRDHRLEVERDHSADVGRDRTTVVERNETLSSRTGDIHVEADSKTITVKAAQSIRLVCGGSSITLTPEGVSIDAPKVSVTGDVEVVIKGGMVQIQP